MCGIVGFNWKDPVLISKLNNLQKHRGPDDEGVYSTDLLSLGQRRLAVIDLSPGGFQPMFYTPELGAYSQKHQFIESEGNSYIGIVFNGEIYNYLEIRQELVQKGYKFSTHSDTEVILASYWEWGENCLNKFNGMWAFGLYDARDQTLFLARDRMGKKPIYYYAQNGKFIFGSELKTIISTGINRDIDENALNHYLLFGFTPSSQSMLHNVYKFRSGHYMIYNLTAHKIEKYEPYWKINFTTNKLTFDEAKTQIRQILDDAVGKRLIADVPVGAFLSGGVDSSVIVSLMRPKVKDLKTFSVQFDHEEFNESRWAKLVAHQFQTDHYQIQFTAQQVLEHIPELVYSFDEPFSDTSMIPTFLVSKVARQHVTVCLSGTGGDELFGGYDRYQEGLSLDRIRHFPKIFQSMGSYAYSFINQDKAKKLKILLQATDKADMYLKLFSNLFRGEVGLQADLSKHPELRTYFNSESLLTNMLNFDQHIYLNNGLLVKEDRATMANSLEGRIPFLDYRLVELANSLPDQWKIKGKEGKWILKKTFENQLPKEILYRPKKGFGVPLANYFRKELKAWAYSQLFDFQGYNYYDKSIIRQLWNQHQSGKSDYSYLFWGLITFNMWYDYWLKNT